jgi:hypothetical protein
LPACCQKPTGNWDIILYDSIYAWYFKVFEGPFKLNILAIEIDETEALVKARKGQVSDHEIFDAVNAKGLYS